MILELWLSQAKSRRDDIILKIPNTPFGVETHHHSCSIIISPLRGFGVIWQHIFQILTARLNKFRKILKGCNDSSSLRNIKSKFDFDSILWMSFSPSPASTITRKWSPDKLTLVTP